MEGVDEFLGKNFILIRVLEAENDCDINFYNDEEIASYVMKINKKINDLKELCNEIVSIKEERDNEISKYDKNEEERERLTNLKDINDEYVKKNEEVGGLERENLSICEEIENKKIELERIRRKIEFEKKKDMENKKREEEYYDKSIEKCQEITCLEDNIKKIKEKEKQISGTIENDEKNIQIMEEHLKNILKLLHKCQRSYEAWVTGEEENEGKLLNLIDVELKNFKKIQNEVGMDEHDRLNYEKYLEEENSEREIKSLEKEYEDIGRNIKDNIKQLNDLQTEIYHHQLKKLEKQLLYAETKARLDIQKIKEKRQQQISIIEKILPKPTIYQTYKSNNVKKKVVPTIYTDDVMEEDTFEDSITSNKGKELKKIKEEVESNKILIDGLEEELENNLELRMATLLTEDDDDFHSLVEELSQSIASLKPKIPNKVLSQRIKQLKGILIDGISLLQDEKMLLQKKLSLIVNEVGDFQSLINQLQSTISLKEKNLNKCLKNKTINEERYKSIIEKVINDNYEEYQEMLGKVQKQEEEIDELKKYYEWLTKQRNEKKVELNQKKVDNSNISNKLKVASKKYDDNVTKLHQEEALEKVIDQLENDILSLKNDINEKGEMLKKLEVANEVLKKEIKDIELDREFNITS